MDLGGIPHTSALGPLHPQHHRAHATAPLYSSLHHRALPILHRLFTTLHRPLLTLNRFLVSLIWTPIIFLLLLLLLISPPLGTTPFWPQIYFQSLQYPLPRLPQDIKIKVTPMTEPMVTNVENNLQQSILERKLWRGHQV